MMTAWGAGLIFGAVLGLRFNFLALVPAICAGFVVAAVSGIAHGDGVWSIAGTMVVLTVALQAGYLVTSVLSLARDRKA
jgi:hypothetical protein